MNARELLKWEKELLGFYLSGRPVDRYRRAFEGQNLMKIADLIDAGLAKPEALRVAGEVTDLRKITTRKGELMRCSASRIGTTAPGVIEVVLFPRTYATARWKPSPSETPLIPPPPGAWTRAKLC